MNADDAGINTRNAASSPTLSGTPAIALEVTGKDQECERLSRCETESECESVTLDRGGEKGEGHDCMICLDEVSSDGVARTNCPNCESKQFLCRPCWRRVLQERGACPGCRHSFNFVKAESVRTTLRTQDHLRTAVLPVTVGR